MRILSATVSSFLLLATTSVGVVNAFGVILKKAAASTTRHAYKPVQEESEFDFSDPLRPIVFGQRLLIPFTPAVFDFGNEFQNDGAFAWLIPYSSLMGYKPGNTLVGGLSTTATTTSDDNDERTAQLRQQAATSLMNISDEEQATRIQLGYYMYLASALYATYSTLFLDDGSLGGHVIRFVGLFPLFLLGRGYQLSGNMGV